jgi:hypothetical protein
MIEPGEIVFCNLTCKTDKGKALTVKRIVFSCGYNGLSKKLLYAVSEDQYLINKFGLKEDIEIVAIEVISSLGYRHKHTGFSEVRKGDEVRNKITGAYE